MYGKPHHECSRRECGRVLGVFFLLVRLELHAKRRTVAASAPTKLFFGRIHKSNFSNKRQVYTLLSQSVDILLKNGCEPWESCSRKVYIICSLLLLKVALHITPLGSLSRYGKLFAIFPSPQNTLVSLSKVVFSSNLPPPLMCPTVFLFRFPFGGTSI